MMQLRPRFTRTRGFTLIEASLATVIIGVGVVAMLELIAAGTRVNVDGAEKTTATNLAKNVREYTLKLPYSQVIALGGQTWSTPIDSRGEVLTEFDGWQQRVGVRGVDTTNLNRDVGGATNAYRVTVTVLHNGETISTLSWYVFRAGS